MSVPSPSAPWFPPMSKQPRLWLVWAITLWCAAVAVRIALAESFTLDASPDADGSNAAQDGDRSSPAVIAAVGDHPALYLARVCFLEATWSEPDCAAIYWIARKRAARVNRDWLDVLHRYSALDKQSGLSGHVRSRSTRPAMSSASRRASTAGGERCASVVAGEVIDPCPPAVHWGSKSDVRRAGMALACCDGNTANTLYSVTTGGS